MKGVIESFSAELDQGIIFGDDKNRYNFSSSNWKDTKKSPRRGLRVIFETEDEKAVEIHLAKSYVNYLLASAKFNKSDRCIDCTARVLATGCPWLHEPSI